MNGTMEQFRIGGTISIIEKDFDQSKLDHLNSSITLNQSVNDINSQKA